MALIIIALAKMFSKTIEKIKILNIDGTYNKSAQNLKHILSFIAHGIIPITLLITTVLFTTIFKTWIDFYSLLIIWCLAFYIAGSLVEKIFLAELEEELDIRNDVAKDNAKARRASLS